MALSKIVENSITDGVVSSAKLKDFSAAVDLNGVELILDADADTSITADTDDRIDLKIGGAEHISFGNSSGDTIIKVMANAMDIVFQQYDGNKVFQIHDGNFVSVGGNSAGPGELRFYEDTDHGAHYTGFKSGNNTESISYVLPLADASSSGYALTSNASGVLSWSAMSANTPTSADGQALGSATLEWSDLFLADASTIQFGADQDTTLTHVADTGILLNSTRQLQFGDSGTYIHQSADGVLDLVSDTEIEINATTIDINGNVEISGTLAQVGVATFTARDIHSGGITIANDGTIGSVGDADSIAISSAGVVTMTQIPVLSAGLNVSGGTITGTLATAAQANITSVGTLTALTVDDVAVDGKVITMTGSSGDTFVTTVGTNGATSLVTVDTAAAAAHLTITADGTVDINSAGVLTLDSGAAINIEPAAGSAILLDGTISIDAGVVTGATSITSTAFVGGLTGNVTGNASGTALTVTQAAQTAITSVGTLASFRSTGIDDNSNALAMTIDSNERIGIGTASPQNPLEISGDTNYLARFTQTGTNKHMFKTVGNGASMDFIADGANNYVGFNSTTSGDDIRFQTNDGNERMRMLAAGGLTFNGDTAAANALDDYEEGTFTTTAIAGSGTITLSSSQDLGAYVKIGSLVHWSLHIGVSSTSSASGDLYFTLPFTLGNFGELAGEGSFACWVWAATTGDSGTWVGWVERGSNRAYLRRGVGTQPGTSANLMTGGTEIRMSGTFRTA